MHPFGLFPTCSKSHPMSPWGGFLHGKGVPSETHSFCRLLQVYACLLKYDYLNHITMKLPYFLLRDAPKECTDDELVEWAVSDAPVRAWFIRALRARILPSIYGSAGRPAVDETKFTDLIRSLAPDEAHPAGRSSVVKAMQRCIPISTSAAITAINRLEKAGVLATRPGRCIWHPRMVWALPHAVAASDSVAVLS
jgi:hypothetical protein